MRGNSFRYLVAQGVSNVWKNRVMAFASFCILMVSLLLVGFALLLMENIDHVIGNLEEKNEVVIFLLDGSTADEITEVERALDANANLTRVTFRSKEEALESIRAKENMQGAASLIDGVEADVFPDSFTVSVRDLTRLNETVAQMETLPGIDYVKPPQDYAKVLLGVKQTISLVGIAVVAALATVSLVIISNATRTSVFARRREISIMKYVGATNSFVRVPFFVEGIVIGLLAASIALLLTWFGYDSLFKLFMDGSSMWTQMGVFEIIPFDELFWKVTGYYALAGVVISSFGTIFSTRKHLKV